jgi:hypothetical protein
METVVQILGMAFVGIIMMCIGWTIVSYIFNSIGSGKEDKKLLDNMKKMDKKNSW